MPEEVKISNVLSKKAMIARLSASGWSGRVTDKVVTKELTDDKKAEKDAASVTKALVHKKHLKPIRLAVQEMKKFHNEHTLPWDNNGGRLLPSTKYSTYNMKFRECERALNSAVTEFIKNYQNYVVEAQTILGDLFDQNDYPHVSEIQNKFELGVVFEKVPEAGDFRVDIPEHEQKLIRQKIEEQVEGQHADAMKKIWTRIFKAVEHMNERLSEEDGIFHKTMVDNIENLVDVLPELNIMQDENLTKMTEELKTNLCGYTADDLRKNKVLRKEAAEKSKEIMDKIKTVGTFFGDVAQTPAPVAPEPVVPDQDQDKGQTQDQDKAA